MKKSKRAKRDAYAQSKDKVLVLEAQIQAMMAGELTSFHCPFCNTETQESQMLCCDQAGDVITAILDHVEFQQSVKVADQIMDRFSRLASKAIVN